MDANEFIKPERPQLSVPGIFGLGMFSLVLYLSGIFVWLTPLPIFYAFKNGRGLRSLSGVLLPAILLVAAYGLLMPMMMEKFGVEQASKFFFWLPGIGLGSESSWNPAIFGIVYFLFFAMMGALLGEMEPKPYTMTRLVGLCILILAGSLVFWLSVYTWGHWSEFMQGIETYFAKLLQELTKVQPANEEMQSQWSLMKDHAATISYYAARLLPAMILNLMIFLLWLNILVARRLSLGAGKVFLSMFWWTSRPEGGELRVFPSIGRLDSWGMPFVGVWILIGFAFLWISDMYVLKVETLSLVALNAFLVFALIYFFQGLAVAVFYLNRWKLSRLVRWALYFILILFFQPLSFLLVAFGFFDSWFDFRKLALKSA